MMPVIPITLLNAPCSLPCSVGTTRRVINPCADGPYKPHMDMIGIPTANAKPVPAPATNPNATGLVAFHPTEGMTTSRIRYEAGARTNWHTHTGPQMLWAEDGIGLWQERGDPIKQMQKDYGFPLASVAGLEPVLSKSK